VSRTSQLATVLADANGAWVRSSRLADETDIEPKHVSALLANLRGKGLIESRKTNASSGECEYRVNNAGALAEYLELVAAGKRAPYKADAQTVAAGQLADDDKDDDPGVPRITRSNGGVQHVPVVTALGDALLGSPAPHTYTPPRRAEPSTDKPAACGLTWVIDHRGKLILCLGEAAFELQPRQWAPLARFLEPLAEVFV
jgi:hypothetical protein